MFRAAGINPRRPPPGVDHRADDERLLLFPFVFCIVLVFIVLVVEVILVFVVGPFFVLSRPRPRRVVGVLVVEVLDLIVVVLEVVVGQDLMVGLSQRPACR